MATVTIRRLNGRRHQATYVRHLRTLAYGLRSHDVDLYRLADGTEIQCMSKTSDGRDVPAEVDVAQGHYPGYPAGV